MKFTSFLHKELAGRRIGEVHHAQPEGKAAESRDQQSRPRRGGYVSLDPQVKYRKSQQA
jgi:hypothetical protein